MFILVLTGGLGSGKTTASEYFRSRGATIVDLDDVAAHALTKGSVALQRVAERFGDVLLADGSLDRPALARVAFSSPQGVVDLNALVHPAVAREVGEALRELRLLPHQPEVVVLEVPLLVEAPVFGELADEVLALVAPEKVRIDRAVSRGMSLEEVTRRIRAQATDAERAEVADEVIVNDGAESEFLEQLADYWERRIAASADPR